MAALDLGLVHLEREGAQRERDVRWPPFVVLRSTAATNVRPDQDGDRSARGSPLLDDLCR
jgi:hypothetical protein